MEEESKNHKLEPILEDRVLQILVSFAISNIEVGITLYVGGLIISGTIISAQKYFRLFSESMRTASGNISEGLIDAIASSFAPKEIVEEEIDVSDAFKYQAPFIHLKDALIIQTSGSPPEIKIPLTRIKIVSVDGFTLGNIR